jgi:hypothetical protein
MRLNLRHDPEEVDVAVTGASLVTEAAAVVAAAADAVEDVGACRWFVSS